MDTFWLWPWVRYAAAAMALVTATAMLIIYILRPPQTQRRPLNLPPGPRGVPLLGNLLQLGMGMEGKANESLAALAAKHGALMTLRLGRRTAIVVSSASVAKHVLKTHDSVICGRTVPHVAEPLEHCKSAMAFAQTGPYWRMLRRVSTTHFFTSCRLQSLQPLRQQKLLHMLNHVLSCGTAGLVDVGQTVLQLSVNLLGNMVFGRDIFQPYSTELQLFKDTSAELSLLHGLPNIADFLPILRPLDPQRLYRRAEKAFADMYSILEPLIYESLQQGNTTTGFLSALLEPTNEDFTLQIPRIRAFIADMFMAGTDTVSATVEWAMAELMKNPELMRRVELELDAVVGLARLVQEEDIESLPYLGAVVKETLRLHPAVPLIPRRTDQAVQICGYDIPRDASVIINVWAIGRDPAVWQQPHSFWPPRFMTASGTNINFKGQHFEFIPFGSGRRLCVGLPLAAKMVHITLAHLIQCFDWSLPCGVGPEDLDMGDRFGLTLRKVQPLLLHASPRLPLHLYSLP